MYDLDLLFFRKYENCLCGYCGNTINYYANVKHAANCNYISFYNRNLSCKCPRRETLNTLVFIMDLFGRINEKYFSSIEPETIPYITVCSRECFEDTYNIVPDKLKVYAEGLNIFHSILYPYDAGIIELVIKEIINQE
jgi:hypothetical protein